MIVSIHAPVMGAKGNGGNGIYHDVVSIHAPVMGANVSLTALRRGITFQSTHP